MVSLILKFFKILNSEDSPRQIALAIWFAFLLSFLSFTNILAWIIFLVVCLVRVNLTAFILFFGLFSLVSPLYLGLADSWGYALLTQASWQSFWVALMSTSFGIYSHLNYSVVTGGLVLSAIMLVPSLLLLPMVVKQYRIKILPFVERSKLVQGLKASKIYNKYLELR